jgi:DNA-binding FadR family transcriptional regulator
MNVASETLEAADIVRLLGEVIVTNGLSPGDRLPSIRELATQFGVKTGIVRDALLTAQARGIVKILPRVGAILQSEAEPGEMGTMAAQSFDQVISRPDQNLFHILETREALELTTVARAAERRELPELFRLRKILSDMADSSTDDASSEYARLDVEFHLEIGRLAGNVVMTSLLQVLLVDVRPHLDRIIWSGNRRAETNQQHARIYAALAAGDAEQAQVAMREHIRVAYDSLLDEMRRPPAMNGEK